MMRFRPSRQTAAVLVSAAVISGAILVRAEPVATRRVPKPGFETRFRNPASSQSPDFEARIRPLLAANCYDCHAETAKGGLRLDSRDAMLKGGDSGPAHGGAHRRRGKPNHGRDAAEAGAHEAQARHTDR